MKDLKKNLIEYCQEKNIENQVSWFCFNPSSNETELYRENEIYLAASTIKVAVCMAWIDLIEKGIVTADTKLQFLERHYEESDEKALYHSYQFGDWVPLRECMELAIIYSDNPSNHMMREYYAQLGNQTFREWFAKFSKEPVSQEFYTTNQTTAAIMLEVMKELYSHEDKYAEIIEYMKCAAKGRYIQANHFAFEVAQKYGEYEQFEHTIAILYREQPLLVGIYTELAHENAKEVIRDLSKIMAENA